MTQRGTASPGGTGSRPARASNWRVAALAYGVAAILVVVALWYVLGRDPASIGDGTAISSPPPSPAVLGLAFGSPPSRRAADPCEPREEAEPAATALDAVGEAALDAIGINDPGVLSYLPARRALLAAETDGDLPIVTLFGDRAGTLDVEDERLDVARVTYHAPLGEYLAWNPGEELVAVVPAAPGGGPLPDEARPLDLRGLGIESLESITVDALTGNLYLVDGDDRRVVSVPFSPAPAQRSAAFDAGVACDLTLALPDGARLSAIGVQPGGARVFAVGAVDSVPRLYELDANGRQLASHDLTALGLSDVSAMTFGPASDPRDAGRSSLYLAGAGAGEAGGSGRLVELATGTAAARTAEYLALVASRRTSEWPLPSTDPSGIAYDIASGLLVVTDSEIDEVSRFHGVNVFFVDPSLTPVKQTLTAFTDEPSDVAYDPVTGDYLVSSDSHARIHRISLGADGVLGGDDDLESRLSTASFGSRDPNGLAVGQGSLFLTDGVDGIVYRLTPGPDGEFTGIVADGDDVAAGFDTAALGVNDPDGIAYDPERGTLFLVTGEPSPHVVEVTTAGVVLRSLDLAFLPLTTPAGIALAPSSDDPAKHSIYIADRGIDQSQDPDQSDGLLVEVRIEAGDPPNPVRNGGFEADVNADGLPDGWELTGGARLGAAYAHSGDGALRLAAGAEAGDARYEVTVPSTAAGGLAFSGWVRALPGAVGDVTARLSWRNADGVTLSSERLAIAEPGADWVEMSGVAPPASGAVEARLILKVSSGAVVLDDIVLTSVP